MPELPFSKIFGMDWGRLIERKLQEAREAGVFDRLSRNGELDLDDDAHVPEEDRMAMRLLKNNNMAPAWIEEDKGVREKLFAARESVTRAYARRLTMLANAETAGERMAIEDEWKLARDRFARSVDEINKDIFNFNLRAPSLAVQRMPLRLSEEMDKLERAASRGFSE
jgi:hypothetical protein